ncbi:MAG TPA: hypothetical protein VGL34_28750 [Steroidobacteraceae bacterium]|jgi:hypothetical protein
MNERLFSPVCTAAALDQGRPGMVVFVSGMSGESLAFFVNWEIDR